MNAVNNAFYAAEFDYFESDQMRGSEILVRSGSVIKTVWKNPQSARYTPSLSGKDARLADAWQDEDDSGVVFVEIIGSAEKRPLDITLHLNPLKGEVKKPPEPLVMPLFFMNEGSEGGADEPLIPPVSRPPTVDPVPTEPPAPIHVGPGGNLRKAIEGESGEVSIMLAGNGDIVELEGIIEIKDGVHLTINGGFNNSKIVRSNDDKPFFTIAEGSSLTLKNVTLDSSGPSSAAIYSQLVVIIGIGATLTLADNAIIKYNGDGLISPEGVRVEGGGTLIMNSDTAWITSNNVSYGLFSAGGVYVASGSYFKLRKGTISGNRSWKGGGVYNDGTFTMSGGTIRGNSANYGGGVYNNGTFEMSGGDISSVNDATQGGGVYNDGVFTMTGGTISGNSAVHGNGVYNNGTLKMSRSAKVDPDNSEVYLANDKTIVVGGALDSGASAKINLNVPHSGIQVLSGTSEYPLNTADIEKFVLTNNDYYINSTGTVQRASER